MGNGAEKILAVCSAYNIKISGIIASDAFVRGQTFKSYRIMKLAEAEKAYGRDIIILIAFAFRDDGMFSVFERLCERYTVFVPDVPLFGGELFDDAFVLRNAEALEKTHGLLADDKSKQIYSDIIAFRLSGSPDYIPHIATAKEEAYGLLGYDGNSMYVDCGAYDGDTIREVLAYYGKTGGIAAFEPDRKNLLKLRRYIREAGLEEITEIYNMCVWHESAELAFSERAGRQSFIGGDKTRVAPAAPLDVLLRGRNIGFVKYDVEGAEEQALRGSADILRSQSPAVALSLYHRSADMFALPLYLHDINPSYRLYVRRHKYVPAWDFNLYAAIK